MKSDPTVLLLKSTPRRDFSLNYTQGFQIWCLISGGIEGRWRPLFKGIGYSRQISLLRVQPIQINGADQPGTYITAT